MVETNITPFLTIIVPTRLYEPEKFEIIASHGFIPKRSCRYRATRLSNIFEWQDYKVGSTGEGIFWPSVFVNFVGWRSILICDCWCEVSRRCKFFLSYFSSGYVCPNGKFFRNSFLDWFLGPVKSTSHTDTAYQSSVRIRNSTKKCV